MPSRKRNSTRKSPQQARARATVDAIVSAAAQVLDREGIEAASTNRIAEAAGVSIGSLYQYFPSKEALLEAVSARHAREVIEGLEPAMLATADAPLPDAVRMMVKLALGTHAADARLHRALLQGATSTQRPPVMDEFFRRMSAALRVYFEIHRSEIRPQNIAMAIFVLMHSVDALGRAAVIEHPEFLHGDEFVDEVTALVVGYLRRG